MGISSFGGKEIRKWSYELYKRILEGKKKVLSDIPVNTALKDSSSTESGKPKDDLILILKLRLANGEITENLLTCKNIRIIID